MNLSKLIIASLIAVVALSASVEGKKTNLRAAATASDHAGLKKVGV